MTGIKRGLRAAFECERLAAFVQPTGEVVKHRGRRYQRLKIREMLEEPRFLLVPVEATRASIELMLECERLGQPRYRQPVFATVRHVDMPRDDPNAERIRMEAEYRTAMPPADIALVDEFNELDALRQAGQLPDEKETRWYILARAVDGIWYRAAVAWTHGLHDETDIGCP